MDIMVYSGRLLPTLLWIGYITSIEATEATEATQAADLTSLFLRFYTGETTKDFLDGHLDDDNTIPWSIDNSKPTVLYVHGWSESVESLSVRTIVDAYLHRDDHNVLAADWSKIAGQKYLTVITQVRAVGAAFAAALEKLIYSGFVIEKLHVVGHSMGAQVSGHIGRALNFSIPRITGLDPAGPLFNFLEPHLSAKDARFVDIIHTDFGFYGISQVTGSASFFPNGGHRIQPGCPHRYDILSKEDFCSHHRSWQFYAESLLTEDSFIAVKCNSNVAFLLGQCEKNERAIMGFATSLETKGKFYLRTNKTYPYGLKRMQKLNKMQHESVSVTNHPLGIF